MPKMALFYQHMASTQIKNLCQLGWKLEFCVLSIESWQIWMVNSFLSKFPVRLGDFSGGLTAEKLQEWAPSKGSLDAFQRRSWNGGICWRCWSTYCSSLGLGSGKLRVWWIRSVSKFSIRMEIKWWTGVPTHLSVGCWGFCFKIYLVMETTLVGREFFGRWLIVVGICFCWGKDCEVKKDAFVTGFVFPTLLGILMWVLKSNTSHLTKSL